jgi:putative copper resistance protein D
VSELAVLARWLHLAGGVALAGSLLALLWLVRPALRAGGPEAAAALPGLDARLLGLARASLGLVLATGLLDLWRQVGVATDRDPLEGFQAREVLAVLGQTRYGTVWLIRHALLVLAGLLLAFREPERDDADWTAYRLQLAGLACLALALAAGSGHAASAEGRPALSLAVHAAHLLATAAWAGGLPALALLLGAAGRLPPAAGIAAAAAGVRRFSRLGLAAVLLLLGSGGAAAWDQVGSFPALAGTGYGRWLTLKLALLLPLFALAGLNRLVLQPRLARPGAAEVLPRARRAVAAEALLVLGVLGVVAVLSLTTPARHDGVAWPFGFRLSWEATRALPGVQVRVAVGSQVAVLGLVTALLGAILRQRRWPWVTGAGLAGIVLGLGVALPPLAIDAYPTTYLRPPVPYSAEAVLRGARHYAAHCAGCHGPDGRGTAAAAGGGGAGWRAADLTANHAGDHSAGDFYWWVSHGMPGRAMPGFADRLPEEARWEVIAFARYLGAVARALTGGTDLPAAALAAPDFGFSTGVGEWRTLRDLRDRPVVLAFFALPQSLDRLGQLGQIYPALRGAGAELVAVPAAPLPDLYRRLGPRPFLFPFAAEGGGEAAAVYAPLGGAPISALADRTAPPAARHLEVLVDRQGYVRGRWTPGQPGWEDPATLVADVERLAREAPAGPPADEHVH